MQARRPLSPEVPVRRSGSGSRRKHCRGTRTSLWTCAKRIRPVQMPDPNAPAATIAASARQQAMTQMLSSALQPQAAPAPAAPAGLPAAAPATYRLHQCHPRCRWRLLLGHGAFRRSLVLWALLWVPPSGPAAPPPVILGPNGQPLPPSIPGGDGLVAVPMTATGWTSGSDLSGDQVLLFVNSRGVPAASTRLVADPPSTAAYDYAYQMAAPMVRPARSGVSIQPTSTRCRPGADRRTFPAPPPGTVS